MALSSLQRELLVKTQEIHGEQTSCGDTESAHSPWCEQRLALPLSASFGTFPGAQGDPGTPAGNDASSSHMGKTIKDTPAVALTAASNPIAHAPSDSPKSL